MPSQAERIRGDIEYATSHPDFLSGLGHLGCEAFDLYKSLSHRQKAAFVGVLDDNEIGQLSPFASGCYGMVLESADNQLVTIYPYSTRIQQSEAVRIHSKQILQPLIEPIMCDLGDEKKFKIDPTPALYDPMQALAEGIVSKQELIGSYYDFLDVSLSRKLVVKEDIYLEYELENQNGMAWHLGPSKERPSPDEVGNIIRLKNLGFLHDFKSLITYDSGCLRATEDSILDEGVSQAQLDHARAMGLEYGTITVQSETPEMAASLQRDQQARKR